MPALDNEITDWVAECVECGRVCEDAVVYCRTRGGEYADRGRIGALVTCVALSGLVVSHARDGSEITPAVVDLFTEACDAAAAACEPLDDDPRLRACGEVCALCATRVRELIAGGESV